MFDILLEVWYNACELIEIEECVMFNAQKIAEQVDKNYKDYLGGKLSGETWIVNIGIKDVQDSDKAYRYFFYVESFDKIIYTEYVNSLRDANRYSTAIYNILASMGYKDDK